MFKQVYYICGLKEDLDSYQNIFNFGYNPWMDIYQYPPQYISKDKVVDAKLGIELFNNNK